MSSIGEKPDFPVLVELTKHIKSDSKTGIVSCLTCLKSDPKSFKQFTRDGGLHILINLLKYQNLKILNMVLSILANAFMTPEARGKVRGSKIAPYVVHITKNLKLSNALHCRACRLIGNLSECNWHAKSFFEAGAIQALLTLLKSESNMQTYLMAVRATRNIWSMHEGSREEILDSGIIKSITALLVTARKKVIERDPKYSELIEACLKAICAFLINLDPRCGDQIRGENDVQGFKCIVECCENNNKLAIKCLYSLCHIPECRPVLGASGAVEGLISLISEQKIMSKEIVASLCLFCREAVNRARVRCNCGLEIMLDILRTAEHERYHYMLLHALAQFVYDDPSMAIMVKNGLLNILVTKLNKMVAQIPIKEDDRGSKKRANDDISPNRKGETKYNKTNYGRFSLDYYHRDDWSPSSATSASSSPPSTPPLPFYDSTETDENAEDNYSPVCSDTDWADNEEEPQQEEVESVKSCRSLTIDAEDSCDSGKYNYKPSINEYANVWTLVLLSRLSHSDDPIEKLADPTTIEPLAAYVKYAKNQRASRILSRIVRNRAYLMPLLKQGFVFEAQNLYGSDQYTKHLCALAETGGAVGELTAILLRGEELHKLTIAVSIPFLIKSKYLLKSLLNYHGGLRLIFSILTNREHSLYENAIWSICQLAHTLQIRPEVVEKCQTTDYVPADYPKSNDALPTKPSTVTFELDDGTTVEACRRVLCQRSDAFSAMLEGNFSESGKRRVKLRNTSKEGLNTLLLAANGATFENRTIESLLDAVLLADKFLMSDISDILTESSISKLNHQNFSRAWHWAKNNSCHELKYCCVKRFLTAKMSKDERYRAFHDFSVSENFHEFLDDLKEIINSVLCPR